MAMSSYDQWGNAEPASPVVVSVPHAGRHYPPELLAATRVPPAALRVLEDRCVDAVALAARRDEAMLVQRTARAWIDLNRSERERDPKVDAGMDGRQPLMTAKLRAGLGLVPRRVSGAGDLWRGRFPGAAIEARIVADHRPYHQAMETLLLAARARWGVAVLLDVHSMPPLAPGAPRVVFGDRHGHAAGRRFTTAALRAVGTVSAVANVPYAGGHITERHGRPHARIHALQLELDRSLYLDPALDGPGEGLAATAALVRGVIDALAAEALAGAVPLAAE